MTEPFACPMDPYCVGMCSWTGCPGNADMATFEPHPESAPSLLPINDADATLNTNEPHPSSTGRFALVSDQEIAKLSEGLVPQNTAKMNSWALKNFHDWMKNRNQCNPTDPVRDDSGTSITNFQSLLSKLENQLENTSLPRHFTSTFAVF